MLVDDEKDILYTFKKILASEGYNVKAFVDPMEALTHFAKSEPSHYNLAILDIRMPGLNGLQLYFRLKAINRNIKILFVSALDAVPELTSILPDVKTINDIIKRPVALDDFISTVRTALPRYFSFITPEAYYSINDWMTYRRECGESINEDSWVMRNLWNSTTTKGKGNINLPRNLKSTGVKQLMQRALFAQGLRKKLEGDKKRHEFQSNHAFRKWFKTCCEMAGMKPLNVEVLMGHSTGISDSYYRATENELLEDYLKAVDFLTIDDKSTITKQFSDFEEKKNVEITQLNQDLHEKSRELEVLYTTDNTKDDAIAALSDKLQNLMEEVENLKRRK